MNFSGKFGSASVIWYPASGYRIFINGSLLNDGTIGYYWSVTLYSYHVYYLYFDELGSVGPSFDCRADGHVVRCLQE